MNGSGPFHGRTFPVPRHRRHLDSRRVLPLPLQNGHLGKLAEAGRAQKTPLVTAMAPSSSRQLSMGAR